MNGNYDYTYSQHEDLYTEYSNKKIKEAKRTFSRFYFGIVVYLAVSNLVAIGAEIIIAAVAPSLFESIYFRWFFGVVPMYLIGLPILFLMVKGMKTQKRPSRKMTALGFFKYFLMGSACMYVGNIIGNTLNSFIGALTGEVPENTVSDMITDSPIWLITLVTVILAPIVEEFIFRKLMIDRISRFGEGLAIFTSALAFGLFHGNLYQFFYAFAVGLLLGYIYAKTGNVLHSILMHALMNFFGSVATMPILKYAEVLDEFALSIENGTGEISDAVIRGMMAIISYTIVQNALVISGITLIVIYLRKKLFKVSHVCEFIVPRESRAGVTFGNPGAIVFLVISGILMSLEILLPLL